jgi:lysophospholipase L1-like esterase
MSPRSGVFLCALLITLAGWFGLSLHGEEPRSQCIVFIGDSITDGGTCPLLFRQALADAGKPVPVCVNAGVASDTAKDVLKRLDRDVLVHKPTLVTLSIGINDVLRKVKPADYEADVAAFADRMKAAKIDMLILTPSILGPKHAEAEKRLEEYIAILRASAKKHGFRIAEVHQLMQEARKAGRTMTEPDDVHLSFDGYQVMTRAVLDGLGYKNVAVPKELKLQLMPGTIQKWQMRPIKEKEPVLDEKSVAAIAPDDSWKTVTLPEKAPKKHWWMDHERQRGVAVSLDTLVGPGKGYIGLATVDAEQPRDVFFNTGAQLQAIWLNGKRIYKNEGWTGWHPGKERIAARLSKGRNTVVIEVAGPAFFLSITDTNNW